MLRTVLWLFLILPTIGHAATGEEPGYIGSQNCILCHAEQGRLWRGSHHDLAMQPVTEETVLGDFGDARFEHQGVVTRFFRRDGRYLVETQGQDGEQHEFEVAYAFGVDPLQQYLISMPGGRFQALTVAWDSRPAADGGQRWFTLYPNEHIVPGDELHWTAPAHNWNFACAECHSTELMKNYDPVTDTYQTTWSDINVGCEACHGPGARHAAAAQAAEAGEAGYPADHALGVKLTGPGQWRAAEGQPTAVLSAPRQGAAEVELCGRCHSRRTQLSDDDVPGEPFTHNHRIELLTPGRYFPDGQILDEVYVYGSFVQSRMHAAGVTCSDCHEPHSLRLRAEGNAVCLSCHSAEVFDGPGHHFHAPGTAGARCVECHMPERTYMVVDPRRDHSIRIPRPDLSLSLGVPNACTGCHVERSDKWAAEAIEQWYGDTPAAGAHPYAQALADAARNTPGAAKALSRLALDADAPWIARATALSELGAYLDSSALPAVAEGLASANPLMRRAAVEALDDADIQLRWQALSPMLDEPVLSVRVALAEALADIRVEQLDQETGAKLARLYDDYLATQRFNADRAEHWLNIGAFHLRQGNAEEAESAYRDALKRDPGFAPAYVNLADLYRATGRDEEAGRVLREAIEASPQVGLLHHAYGLWQVRSGSVDAGIESLAKSWALAPTDPRFGYVYGVALDSTGRTVQAIEVWESVLKVDAGHVDTLLALATKLAQVGQQDRALLYAQHLLRLRPEASQYRQLYETLKSHQR